MPIPKREILDLNDPEQNEARQLTLGLDLPEVEIEGVTPEVARQRSEAARRVVESGKPAPWLDEYFALRDKGWPWRQAAYIAWASTPSDKRDPKTQQELAKQLGLTSDRAISTWRVKNAAMQTAIEILSQDKLWPHRADAYDNLIEGMNKSGADYKFFNHLKLYMEMVGDYVPTSQYMAELKKKINSDYSDYTEEQINIAAKAFDDFRAKNAKNAENQDASAEEPE